MTSRKKAKLAYKKLSENNFEKLTRGDIIFTNKNSDSTSCNHCGLYLTNGLILDADFKVKIRPLSYYFTGKHNIYIFHRKNLTDNEKSALVGEAFRHWGKWYNIKGIIGQFLTFVFGNKSLTKKVQSKNRPYCSKMIFKIYKKVGIELTNSKLYKPTPNDLLLWIELSLNWIKIFEFCCNK